MLRLIFYSRFVLLSNGVSRQAAKRLLAKLNFQRPLQVLTFNSLDKNKAVQKPLYLIVLTLNLFDDSF